MAPIPSLIPENAPFSAEQRAWLNGFFAAYLGVNGEPEAADAAAPESDEPDEDQPWHDPSLAMAERLALAKDRKPQRQLMAATAQLDCGQCGYLCQPYAEAVWTGAEPDRSRRRSRIRRSPASSASAAAVNSSTRPANSTV